MKKLKLEELAVESFETAATEGRAGTVVAHAPATRYVGCKDTVEDYTCGIWCPPPRTRSTPAPASAEAARLPMKHAAGRLPRGAGRRSFAPVAIRPLKMWSSL